MLSRGVLVCVILLAIPFVVCAQQHSDTLLFTIPTYHKAEADSFATAHSLILAIRDSFTIVGVGDIMMGSNYPDGQRLPSDDGRSLMRPLEWILNGPDITMGNLEGVLLDSGGTAKYCHNPTACYVFRTPTKYVENLVCAGFDLLSLANNHAGDFGPAGRNSTIKALGDAGIGYAGLETNPYTIIERDHVRYGFVAFAPNTGCLSIHDLPAARLLVGKLDSLSDIVIVSFHGGAEGKQYQHVPRENEIFFGEDRGDVYRFSHAMIDAGADIVFGSGPHVPRGVEIYNERFIAYSLGNFCTYGGMNVTGVNGLSPIVRVAVNRKGKFLQGQIIAACQLHNTGVNIDPEKRVIKVMRELTLKDFPESPVHIGEDGLITYLQTR